ncbi:hypothetical protein VTL71DRAFT_7265 [Oculimacula yallundae]|uniref:Uncharacterized protein n=1 Tax=Oculimacula yallundae TaxID=86028 RepID=A0ABR4BWY3_9HELO
MAEQSNSTIPYHYPGERPRGSNDEAFRSYRTFIISLSDKYLASFPGCEDAADNGSLHGLLDTVRRGHLPGQYPSLADLESAHKTAYGSDPQRDVIKKTYFEKHDLLLFPRRLGGELGYPFHKGSDYLFEAAYAAVLAGMDFEECYRGLDKLVAQRKARALGIKKSINDEPVSKKEKRKLLRAAAAKLRSLSPTRDRISASEST